MSYHTPHNLGHRQRKPSILPYRYVSVDKRQLLIDMIEIEKLPLRSSSESLAINLSTAKSIIRLFRKTGRKEIRNRYKNTNNAFSTQAN